jgi:hypothetical protein
LVDRLSLVVLIYIYCACSRFTYLHIQEKRSKMYTSSSNVELVSAVRLKLEVAPGHSRESGSISFPTRIRLGMKHRMYAYVRTYGYEDTVQVRLVVERKNERNTSIIGLDMGVGVEKHAISRVIVTGSTRNSRVS